MSGERGEERPGDKAKVNTDSAVLLGAGNSDQHSAFHCRAHIQVTGAVKSDLDIIHHVVISE